MTHDMKDTGTHLKLSQNVMLRDEQNNEYCDVLNSNCEDTQDFALMGLQDRDFSSVI